VGGDLGGDRGGIVMNMNTVLRTANILLQFIGGPAAVFFVIYALFLVPG
jgi:hypothetical protein